MNLKRGLVLITLIISLTFVASCDFSGSRSPPPVQDPYFGGPEGIKVLFEPFPFVSEQTRRPEVFEDESFPIDVQIQNRGEFDILPGEIFMEILGVNPSCFTGLNPTATNQLRLDKVSQFLPEGGFEIVTFGDAQYTCLRDGTFYDANLFVEYTYPYTTTISMPQICFKEDVRDERICQVDGTKDAFASGGPFEVGTVTERLASFGQIALEIPIKNVGGGRAKALRDDEFSNFYNEISFEVETEGLTCTSRGSPSVVRLINDEGIIRCVSDILAEDVNFVSQVDISLDYYYQDIVAQTVRIIENPKLTQR